MTPDRVADSDTRSLVEASVDRLLDEIAPESLLKYTHFALSVRRSVVAIFSAYGCSSEILRRRSELSTRLLRILGLGHRSQSRLWDSVRTRIVHHAVGRRLPMQQAREVAAVAFQEEVLNDSDYEALAQSLCRAGLVPADIGSQCQEDGHTKPSLVIDDADTARLAGVQNPAKVDEDPLPSLDSTEPRPLKHSEPDSSKVSEVLLRFLREMPAHEALYNRKRTVSLQQALQNAGAFNGSLADLIVHQKRIDAQLAQTVGVGRTKRDSFWRDVQRATSEQLSSLDIPGPLASKCATCLLQRIPIQRRESLQLASILSLHGTSDLPSHFTQHDIATVADSRSATGEDSFLYTPVGGGAESVNVSALVALNSLLTWATSEHQIRRFGDVLNLGIDPASLPPDIGRNWGQLADTCVNELLDRSNEYLSVEDASRELLTEFQPNWKLILDRRVLASNPPTLEEVGELLQVTRERVRQIQVSIEAVLKEKLEHERYRSLRWRAHTLSRALGMAAPLQDPVAVAALEHALRDVQEERRGEVRPLLLHLAGPYLLREGWLVHADAHFPTSNQLMALADDYGLVPMQKAESLCADAGILAQFVRSWLSRLPGWRVTADFYVHWPNNVVAKCIALLAMKRTPASVEELIGQLGEDYKVRGVRARFFDEPRVMRVNRTEWALRAWKMEEYTGINDEIIQRIDEKGGRAELTWLIREIVSQFDVAETSVRAYASAPMFVTENGYIRVRRDNERVAIETDISTCRGVFQSRPGVLSVLLRVDPDTFRGSGRSFPAAAAAFLDVTPGCARRFTYSGGDVAVTWLETSPNGPSLGSIRDFAILHSLSPGDEIRLEFDTTANLITPHPVRPADISIPERVIEALTGIDSASGDPTTLLAQAIGVSAQAVRLRLIERGDERIVASLPTIVADPELDDAFFDLAAVLGRSR